MDLAGLRYFVAVAESRGFTKASELCFVTEPALSRRVRKLELEYGCKLLDRSTHSVALTREGELCLRYAKEALSAFEDFERRMAALAKVADAPLRLAYTTLGEERYVQRIKRGRIWAALELERDKPVGCLQRLVGGRVDAIIVNQPMVESEAGLEWARLAASGISAFVPASSPLSRNASLSLADIEPFPVVTFTREAGPGNYDALMRVVTSLGVELNIIARSTDTDSFRVMIEIEKDIGLMFSTSIPIMRSPTIRCLPIRELERGFDLVLAWKRGDPRSALIREAHTAMAD